MTDKEEKYPAGHISYQHSHSKNVSSTNTDTMTVHRPCTYQICFMTMGLENNGLDFRTVYPGEETDDPCLSCKKIKLHCCQRLKTLSLKNVLLCLRSILTSKSR